MGRCIVAGGKPDMAAPSAGILASEFAVGSVVKLMESGVATEYLVVNQGIPSNSSMYDESCNGTWLLRKDSHSKQIWQANVARNNYKNSTINAWLNGDFFNQFGSIEQAVIKQVKIPFVNGNGGSTVATGENGLSVKSFLLSAVEVGLYYSNVEKYVQEDGAKLSYFEVGMSEQAINKRTAYCNGAGAPWYIRSPRKTDTAAFVVSGGGDGLTGHGTGGTSAYYYARPAIILPQNAMFDGKTLILKGMV